jgi:hypothetical protein
VRTYDGVVPVLQAAQKGRIAETCQIWRYSAMFARQRIAGSVPRRMGRWLGCRHDRIFHRVGAGAFDLCNSVLVLSTFDLVL